MQKVECKCGCGREVNPGKMYIQGHNPSWTNFDWELTNVIQLSDINNFIPAENNQELIDTSPDPETTFIKKDSYHRLSEEAKYVVNLCMNCPAEILQSLTTPALGKITLPNLRKFFLKQWKSKIKVERVLGEVREFTKTF